MYMYIMGVFIPKNIILPEGIPEGTTAKPIETIRIRVAYINRVEVNATKNQLIECKISFSTQPTVKEIGKLSCSWLF